MVASNFILVAFCRSNMAQNHFVTLKSIFHTVHIAYWGPPLLYFTPRVAGGYPKQIRAVARGPDICRQSAGLVQGMWSGGGGTSGAGGLGAGISLDTVASLPPTQPPASSLSPLSCSPQVT